MPNNQKFHKYFTVSALVGIVTQSMTGFWGKIAAKLLEYVFNYLAMKGIYFINVTSAAIETNMDKNTWETIAKNSWELKDKENAGQITISDEEKKKHSLAFRLAFKRFAVYRRVRNN